MMNDPNTPQAPPDFDGSQVDEAADAVKEDLDNLRRRAEERDQVLALLQRTQADFENYQKRSQRERDQERLYAHQRLALDLLPVLDNLDRTVAAANQAGATGPLVQGVNMVLSQALEMLKRHGIARIEAAGKAFDPNLHQAVMRQPASAEHPANTVVQVLEQGYTIHDRVLRPARVIVAMTSE
jgi:molecular chaperone GrpE